MPKQSGIWRQQWEYCAKCGFLYPVGYLAKQKGLLICRVTCFDKLDIERRERQIAEKLADGREAENEKIEKQAEDDIAELEF